MKLNSDFTWPGQIPEQPFQIDKSMVDKLDPEYIKFFNSSLSSRPEILYTHKVPLDALRKGGNVLPGQSSLVEMKSTQDIQIPRKYTKASDPPIPARVFTPKGDKPENGWPVTIWFHGGGWVLGNISTENSFCTHIAELSKCIVISIDYRLAPEDPFPACVEDAFESVLYISEMGGPDFGIDNSKICLAGSSAGGNLTAIICHKFASSPIAQNYPNIKFQAMVVPVTDNTATPQTLPSWKENEFAPQLPAEKMLWYRELYLPNGGEDLTNPESSPLFYPDDSFEGLPAAFIAAGQCDVLRSDAELYADKLQKNGVPTKLVVYKGMPHTVMVMDDVLQQGKDLMKDLTSAVRNAFYS
ncbi:hypothetical protein CLIB1423_52S00100 [[Candida] railenensis]|uniref:Alpha/beta hydrolase fold-3 domain-containing protein n=1 Tax=[Candida] railenensis TaxID=45579 RepID=A0A9P0W1I2_9ASCO|nr:hypothetical protein CLIB1423_52S00100 [[Candida] railenensis]